MSPSAYVLHTFCFRLGPPLRRLLSAFPELENRRNHFAQWPARLRSLGMTILRRETPVTVQRTFNQCALLHDTRRPFRSRRQEAASLRSRETLPSAPGNTRNSSSRVFTDDEPPRARLVKRIPPRVTFLRDTMYTRKRRRLAFPHSCNGTAASGELP